MAHKPRVYLPEQLVVGETASLPIASVKHLITVLRLQNDADIELFNGDGHRYQARLKISGKRAAVEVYAVQKGPPPGRPISLALGISRADRMDYALQKSTELGVSRILPLVTERGSIKLASDRVSKKMQHWNNVMISASEQCGRCDCPELVAPMGLDRLIETERPGFVLDPAASTLLSSYPNADATARCVLVGPESGLSIDEIHRAKQAGWSAVSCGPLVLRTETAALIGVAMLRLHEQLL